MKKLIAGLLAGVTVGMTATAFASTSSVNTQNIHYRGVWCQTGGNGVACIRESGTIGYGTGISVNSVVVMNANNKVVFSRLQPR